MKISRTASFGIGVVATLVIGSGTAYAATGGTFLLGRSNAASTTTTLTNSAGTALSLGSKSGTAPLKVNRSTKVANLNADFVDGVSAGAFALASGQTNSIVTSGELFDADLDDIPDFIAAFATCPSGTKLTGGGGEDDTAGGVLWLTAPISTNTWMVASTQSTLTQDNADSVYAYAQCYSPRGSVTGGVYKSAVRPSPSALDAARARLAKKLH